MSDNTNTNGSNKNDDGLRERMRELMARERISIRGLANELSTPHRSVDRWLKREATEHAHKIEAGVRNYLARRAARDATPFIETRSAERILSALAYAQAYSDIVTVYGGPGVGKTRTIRHFQRSFENVWVATITPASSAVVPALEEISEALGIQDATGGARKMARTIVARIRETGGVLIIDEAQHLSHAAIEEIRSIYDRCCDGDGCGTVGLALCGNEMVYARLTGGARASHFAQLFSRVGMHLYLRRPDGHDVYTIAAHFGVTDKKSLALLERISRRPGALRAVLKTCKLARTGARGEVTYDSLRAAADNLGAES